MTHYAISWLKLAPDLSGNMVDYCSPETQAKLAEIKTGLSIVSRETDLSVEMSVT